MRALAARASESANGVKALIANSTRQIQTGVQLVKQAGTTLQEIVSAASKVASTLLADQSAKIANGLRADTAELSEMVASFTLAGGTERPARAAMSALDPGARMRRVA